MPYRPKRTPLSHFKAQGSSRDLLRRHVQAERYNLKQLAIGMGLKPETLYKMFFDARRPLSPDHVEAAIKWLKLDDFDANALRLVAAREAGWLINPEFLLK